MIAEMELIMLIFISGGVRSGKSTLGERYVNKLSKGDKVYLATSKTYDDEMVERIKKHQNDREKKGFITIEKSENVGEIINKLKKTDTVLLDCLGTLVANEMFYDYTIKYNQALKEKITGKIFNELISIKKAVDNLIIISNEIFSDGIKYDPATEDYIEVLGSLHIKIADISDKAIECVFGNNTIYKGEAL